MKTIKTKNINLLSPFIIKTKDASPKIDKQWKCMSDRIKVESFNYGQEWLYIDTIKLLVFKCKFNNLKKNIS